MNNKEPGYVYILTRSTSGRLHICKNPSFREDWVKIGKSSRPVDVRSKELDNTFVPLSFEKRAQRFLTLLRCVWGSCISRTLIKNRDGYCNIKKQIL